MKYLTYIFLILVCACEQIVEIDIPEHIPQLVLSCHYDSGDTKVVAFLTKSIPILSNDEVTQVENATVRLYEDDVLMGEMIGQPDTLFREQFVGVDDDGNLVFEQYISQILTAYVYELNEPLKANTAYTIQAQATDYEDITATAILPENPAVTDFSYTPEGGLSLDGSRMDAFSFELQDDAEIRNFYEFRLFEASSYDGVSTGNYNRRWLESNTPGLESSRASMLLNDDIFDGGSYNIELLAWPTDTTYNDLELEINALSRGAYLFQRSIEAYYMAEGNPFAEPVILYTNVENGQGIFAMRARQAFRVE